jgi:hypothetical protein
MSGATPPFSRDWIREFEPAARGEHGHLPLVREIVIQEREGNYFDLFLTWPTRRLMTRLTLDECLGYAALAIARGRGDRWNAIEQERDWIARYGSDPRVLEPWEKQLPEHVESKGEPS